MMVITIHEMCPVCGGGGCDHCHEVGHFLHEASLPQLPADARIMLHLAEHHHCKKCCTPIRDVMFSEPFDCRTDRAHWLPVAGTQPLERENDLPQSTDAE